MRTFAKKPKTTQPTASAKASIVSRAHIGQAHDPNSIVNLQRTIGNQAVLRLLQSNAEERNALLTGTEFPHLGHDFARIPISPPKAGALQTKLAINKPGDEYEQEADRVAEQVMRMPEPQLQRACPCGGGCPKCHTEQPGGEHEGLQPMRTQASDTSPILAPPIGNEVLRSPGQPLDQATRAFMETRFGYDFSGVRVHTDRQAAQSAAGVEARAYTVGHDVVFGTREFAPGSHQGKRLIAHELAHVIQQTSLNQSGLGPTPFLQRQPAVPNPRVRERVVKQANVAERGRTVVKIEVVGHASPRWRAAKTPQIADELNWRLAEKRALAVRVEVEKLLQALLPNRTLIFEYHFKPSTDKPLAEPVKALDEPTDVSLDFQGRGSTETLGEAGKRGRKANDDPMRRVEVKVTLHSQAETDVEEDVERSERKPGATRAWSIYITGEAGLEAIGKAGAILIQLRNGKTGQLGTYAGWTSGLGASVGVNIAKTSPPDFESFTTPKPMTFADFSGSNFSITSFGASIGVFGAEWSKFRFDRFGGGQPTPGGIQVGGLSFGGVEVNIGSVVYGAMFLVDNPSEEYTEITRTKRTQTYESLASESTTHRVFFATEADQVTAWQSDMLNEYLLGIVNHSGL
jgi:hypothetical protein